MLNRTYRWGCAFAFVSAMAGASLAQAEEKEGAKPAPGPGQHYRAKQILGSKVTIEGGTEVGTVEDIVLDDGGNVDYLVVANSDDKLVTVPWDAAKFNVGKRVAVVHITPEKFQEVPTYTPDQYPVFSTPAYRNQTYRYYGLTPSQQRRIIQRGAVIAP